jgi:hypothetical protein
LTLTQGGVDLCCDGSGHDQAFASSGSFDLGYLDPGQQDIHLTPLAGPTAKWSITIHALPVILSGLSFDATYLRPTQITTISYHVDGDVTLSATIKNSSGDVVRTLASNLPVSAGDNELTWDGLNSSGSPVPDGKYTVAVSYLDAAGNSGLGHASVEIDGTPPVVTVISPKTLNSSQGLVIDVHDAVSGLNTATLAVDGRHVQSPGNGGSQFIYAPTGGWSPGSHAWDVTATDKAGNTGTTSGTFMTPGCRVPRVIGKTPKHARAAIVKRLCSVGTISRVRSRKRLKGHVIAQHPHAGLLLREHSRVSFTVGLGHRP